MKEPSEFEARVAADREVGRAQRADHQRLASEQADRLRLAAESRARQEERLAELIQAKHDSNRLFIGTVPREVFGTEADQPTQEFLAYMAKSDYPGAVTLQNEYQPSFLGIRFGGERHKIQGYRVGEILEEPPKPVSHSVEGYLDAKAWRYAYLCSDGLLRSGFGYSIDESIGTSDLPIYGKSGSHSGELWPIYTGTFGHKQQITVNTFSNRWLNYADGSKTVELELMKCMSYQETLIAVAAANL